MSGKFRDQVAVVQAVQPVSALQLRKRSLPRAPGRFTSPVARPKRWRLRLPSWGRTLWRWCPTLPGRPISTRFGH